MPDNFENLSERKGHSRPHILFVCGRNKWRSPTAAHLYRNDHRIEVRSAGVSTHARHQVSRADIEWADLILVMERKYASRLQANYRDLVFPPTVSLEIPDEYEYMDEELVEMITRSVEYHIARLLGADSEVKG